MSHLYIVLDSSVLINLLFVSTKLQKILDYIIEVTKKENSKIVISDIIFYKEIIDKKQIFLLNYLIDNEIVFVKHVNREHIEKIRREYSFRLGVGEISVYILVKDFLNSNKLSVGFSNDKLFFKKFEKEIPLLHGIWFYCRMLSLNLIDELELDMIIKIANEDMRLTSKDLKFFKDEYTQKSKISLQEFVAEYIKTKMNKIK
ncbi:MAG: hypothetical protein QW367_01740 [Candidatus Aenigmatarchaeota archaeon]